LKNYHTQIISDEKTLDWLVKNFDQHNIGARDIRRTVRSEVENLVAKIILQGKVKNKYRLNLQDEKLRLT
jgi:ATP-dependent Clp protease ATP-binding subunit ClpA